MLIRLGAPPAGCHVISSGGRRIQEKCVDIWRDTGLCDAILDPWILEKSGSISSKVYLEVDNNTTCPQIEVGQHCVKD